ncbi:hypothetical protein E1263_19075 [Kribbella antibiotica]|uniref:DUF7660 domain-containing protein n=1 Tax=Kribbella antibiotica TaxID=190195 RepID=A0A4R4ZL00_9ACTN|nr:hypothetical protein [Kribbella antibiotica]TDD58514.1 hypothetical protein E1263_19075 [Kribbella antibiotica]
MTDLMCVRYQRSVRVGSKHYEVFERMHYVCFHYEFEHGDADVDEECGAGGCPSASLTGGRDRVIATAKELAIEAASGAPWRNSEAHEYLEAFAAWLSDSGGYYANRGRVAAGNGWDVVNDALKAATTYE